jgi:CubicO group peptidase (beta-lactamase class C family)
MQGRPFRAVAIAVALGTARAAAAAGGGPEARVDAFVRAEMERQKVPGVAIAVVRKGELLLAKGYGFANLEHRVPVTAETIFQSGSVGKQFTAAAVMCLVEDGRLALDDPIRKHLPDAPEAWQAVAVRHLLTHTAGIPDYTVTGFDYRRDRTEEELAKLAYALPLDFAPGSRWSYSNTGYMLLGILIHRVSGRLYGELLAERIFAPLGMATARIISEAEIVPNRAAGYRLTEDGEIRNQEWVAPALNTTADGSLYLSVQDLVAWERGLRARKVLVPGSWEQVFAPVALASGRTYPYGFGWAIDEVAGRPLHQHGGSWQGFRAQISRYVADDLTVIALANLDAAEPERFTEGIAAILEPALARPEPAPIPDREPAVTERVRRLLAAAAAGRLPPEEFAYLRAGFFPETADEYAKTLGPLGDPEGLTLVGRRELGDDRVYTYLVAYGAGAFLLEVGIAPDDRVATFDLRPR